MKTITAFLCAAIVIGNIAFASSDDLPPSHALSIHQIIVKQAQAYGAKEEMISNIGKCESGLSMVPIGAEGEIGAYQFKKGTFDSMSKAMGEKLDIHSFDDQTRLISWVSVSHPEWMAQWSTWRVWYGKGLNRCRMR